MRPQPLLGVVASVCTQLPTTSIFCRTNHSQQCWDLLRQFARRLDPFLDSWCNKRFSVRALTKFTSLCFRWSEASLWRWIKRWPNGHLTHAWWCGTATSGMIISRDPSLIIFFFPPCPLHFCLYHILRPNKRAMVVVKLLFSLIS